MVGVAGFEPTAISTNHPQKCSKSSPWAHICAQGILLTSDLSELIQLWSKLSQEEKSIILMIARKGGDLND